MRISQAQIQQIKTVVSKVFGAQAKVWLFGSRTDDTARGGDIDLFIQTSEPLNAPALLAAKVAAQVKRFQGGRKVDVVVQGANSAPEPIFTIAQETGVLL